MAMSPDGQVSVEWLVQAREKEECYDWLGAVADYRNLVEEKIASKSFLQAGQTQDRIATCYFYAAFQAESSDEFKSRIRAAAEAYQKAAKIFSKMDADGEGRGLCSKAKSNYVRLWIDEEASAKRRRLNHCYVSAKKALEAYEATQDTQGIAEVCNDLATYLVEWLSIESRRDVTQRLLNEADDYCEKAMETSIAIGNEHEMAKAYYNAGRHFYVSVFLRPLTGKTEENRQKALGYLQRAVELFRNMNQPYLSVLSRFEFARIAYSRITLEPKQGMERFEQLYTESSRMRDRHLMARLSFRMALHSWWLMRLEQDPEKKRQWFQRCVDHATRAVDHARFISDDCSIAFAYWLLAYAKQTFAEELETHPRNRRLLLKEAADISRTSIKHAEKSGVLEAVHFAKHSLCISLLFYSEYETDRNRKKTALDEATKSGEECIEAARLGMPSDLWNIGINYCFLAIALTRQAEEESDNRRQEYLIKNARACWNEGKDMTQKYLAMHPDAKRNWAIGSLSLTYGQSLSRLYPLTNDEKMLEEIVRVYNGSASMLSQVGFSSLVGQAQWQIARTLDLQGRFSEASLYFNRASDSFKAAADQTPLVKYWYMDHAMYMLAWKEIEDAKLCSEEENHSESAEHYRKASTYLKETLRWRYLSQYYLALSQVEVGEGFRKVNEIEEAGRMFERAAESFNRAEILLKGRRALTETPEEKEEILMLTRIAQKGREVYSARVAPKKSKVLKTLPRHHERAAGLNAFEGACLRARLVAPRGFTVGKETRIGLDVVNVGRKPGMVVRVEKLVPEGFSVTDVSPKCRFE